MSYLVITHDMEVVRLMCERVIILRHGHVIEAGETRAVLKSPQSDYGRTLLASVPRLHAPVAESKMPRD
jgi:peptide/nickel transport system ATP-binding protein